ncbi:hypothetical protein HY573_01530 [Candidatus Parcubacteria bacterium]|nr:hypothetical protein [Candidatus Parcubacteria bacterium]
MPRVFDGLDFEEIDTATADPTIIIAHQALSGMTAESKLQALGAAFLVAANSHNDGAALALLDALQLVHERTEKARADPKTDPVREKARLQGYNNFLAYAWEKYWDLPDARRIQGSHIATGHPLEVEPRLTLVKTKLRIIGMVGKRWFAAAQNDESIRAFRFLVAAFFGIPWRNALPRERCESEYEFRGQRRFVSAEERDGILRTVRERTDNDFLCPPENVGFWLNLPDVPPEFQKVLAIARARNGGPELAKRDIRNAKLLAGVHELEDRDGRPCLDATRKWIEQQVLSIALLDVWVNTLLTVMQPAFGTLGNAADRIGESDYVLGSIAVTFKFDNSRWITLTVDLPKDCPERLGIDVFGRARCHIEKWRETFYDVTVDLIVQGGAASLNLTRSFLSPAAARESRPSGS